VHHVRKTKSEDVFESISGSAGILGAVDSALILGVNGKDTVNARLHITGRDVMERRDDDAMVMRFDDLGLTWKLSDEAMSVGNYNDDLILAAIKNGINRPIDIADYTGLDYGLVRKRLLHLSHDLGKIEAVKRGYYEFVEQVEQCTQTVVDEPETQIEQAEQVVHSVKEPEMVRPSVVIGELVEQEGHITPSIKAETTDERRWNMLRLVGFFSECGAAIAISHLAKVLDISMNTMMEFFEDELLGKVLVINDMVQWIGGEWIEGDMYEVS